MMLTELPPELLDAVIEQRISQGCSQYTKEFGFELLVNLDPPAYFRKPGCPHHFHGFDRNSDPFLKFNQTLDLMRFPDNQLQSFRWDLATCLPSIILCNKDSFLGNQGNLRSISLITDGGCVEDTPSLVDRDLVQLKKLQSLRWVGLNQYLDFESVSAFIKAYGHQLKSLTLDLLDGFGEEMWTRGFLPHGQTSEREKIPINFFAERVINVNPGDRRLVFDSLENLDLTAVWCFYGMGYELIHAFNIENLKSLRLRRCPGSLRWLRKILKSGKSMSLKSFEFSSHTQSEELLHELKYLGGDKLNKITEVISGIIHHNVDLESIHLMLPSGIDWATLADTLLVSGHHRLVDIVMHPLHIASNPMSRLMVGSGHIVDDILSWEGSSLKSLVQGSRLTCFGSTAIPRDLTHHFQKMEPRPSFKVLHLRVSEVLLSYGPSSFDWHSRYKNIQDHAGYFSMKFIKSMSDLLGEENDFDEDFQVDFRDDPNEIFSFAKWAFGVDGLPNLQVIAGGDFAYQGRYSTVNIMLCRADNAYGYEVLTPTSEVFQGYLQENMEMLGACPWRDIM
ncbi:uncharacterized protein N7483_002917 [Penicillium malachiteum]|uniref:uncharacterized protein n=1 Tax=Penicillium malachiteum TaxID=1324776 RepID=UPI002547A46F|nr:uncharacterized protein N7483_002917 [Penicillium malachiteum]KAJ5737792.1 hypothetical protein N7483_002917 [Penicillium malachiteum]